MSRVLIACALALCLYSDVSTSSAPSIEPLSEQSAPAPSPVKRTSRALSTDAWLNLIAGYSGAAPASSKARSDEWFPRPVPVEVSVGRGDGAGSMTLPLLVLPVPVPVPSSQSPAPQCSLNSQDEASTESESKETQIRKSEAQGLFRSLETPARTVKPLPTPLVRPPVYVAPDPPLQVPSLATAGSHDQLVKLFRTQSRVAPDQPPMIIPTFNGVVAGHLNVAAMVTSTSAKPTTVVHTPYPHQSSQPQPFRRRSRIRAQRATAAAATPPRPRFSHSVTIYGELSVPRAGYTEPYTVRWESDSGAARVDYHGGATSTFRMMSAGTVQHVTVNVDRTGEADVLRCTTSAPQRAGPSDRALPAVPNLNTFNFAGYADSLEGEIRSVERWERVLTGRAGELGATRGESLTFRHQLLLVRAPDNITAIPLRYVVAVDSSVLGNDCEGYEHRYLEMRFEEHEPAIMRINLEETCEYVEPSEQIERLDPMREFTLPQRDPRYDIEFQRYITEFGRKYVDDGEESVRKALLIQRSRFVNSGNRQGSTAVLGVNALGDRLDEEIKQLLGVDTSEVEEETVNDRVRRNAAQFPNEFDWRKSGAVTHVRDQGTCRSCWAFAVVGAVEGALFRQTKRLVPLSEQRVVDCSQPYGGHGCNNSWPEAAYKYIQNHGLIALNEYFPYQAKKLQCANEETPPVTHISEYVPVRAGHFEGLLAAVFDHGPAVVIVDGLCQSFVSYEKGVLHDDKCATAKDYLNHAVLAVGWGKLRNETHFILKNSWSSQLGEDGYVRVHGMSNTCGVLTLASYPVLEKKDVLRLPERIPEPTTDPSN